MTDVAAPVTEGKSPLTSKTVQAAILNLVAQVVGMYYPPLGDWLKAHQLEVVTAVSSAVVYGRHKADEGLDWKNWTIGGVGLKW